MKLCQLSVSVGHFSDTEMAFLDLLPSRNLLSYLFHSALTGKSISFS